MISPLDVIFFATTIEKTTVGDNIAIISLLAGILSGLWAAIRWYGKLQQLIYANSRDLEHAKRNALQASIDLAEMAKSMDEIRIEMREAQTIISMLLAERGQTNSGFLGKRRNLGSN